MADAPANTDDQAASAAVDGTTSQQAADGASSGRSVPSGAGGIETLLPHYDAVLQNQRSDAYRGGPMEPSRPMSASPAPQQALNSTDGPAAYGAPRQISNVFGTREDPFSSVWVAPPDDTAADGQQQQPQRSAPPSQQQQQAQPPSGAPSQQQQPATQQQPPPQQQQPVYQQPQIARSAIDPRAFHARAQSFHVGGSEGPAPRHWSLDQGRSQSFIDMHPSSLALQQAQHHHHVQQQQHLAQAEMMQASPSSGAHGSQTQYGQGTAPQPSVSNEDVYRPNDMVDPGEYAAAGGHASPIPEFGMMSLNDQYPMSSYEAPEPIQAPNLFGEHPHGEHPSRTLFVRNINSNVEDEELLILFEQYGPIRSMYTQCKHRGFVMISYFDIRHAKNAMRNLQGKVLRRRKLDIHYSIPKDNPSEKDQNQAQGTLVVFNLDPTTTNDELRSIFGAFGEIKEIRETPNKRHHKFIEFYDVRDAEKAMKFLNKTEIRGKKIKIEPSRPGGAQRRPMLSPNSGGRSPVYDEASDPLGPPHEDYAGPPGGGGYGGGNSQYYAAPPPQQQQQQPYKPRYDYGQQHRQGPPPNSYGHQGPVQRSSYGSHYQPPPPQYGGGVNRGAPPPQYAPGPGGYRHSPAAAPPHHQPPPAAPAAAPYSAPPPSSYGPPHGSYDPRVPQQAPPPVYGQHSAAPPVYGAQAAMYQQQPASMGTPPMPPHSGYQSAQPSQYGQPPPMQRVGSGGRSAQPPPGPQYSPQLSTYQHHAAPIAPPPQSQPQQYTQFGPTSASPTAYAYEPHSGEYRPIGMHQQQQAPGQAVPVAMPQGPAGGDYRLMHQSGEYHHVVPAPQLPMMSSGEYRTVMQPAVVVGPGAPGGVIMHSSGDGGGYVFNVHSSGEYRAMLAGSGPGSSGEYHSSSAGEYPSLVLSGGGGSGEYRPGSLSNHSSSGEYPPPSSWGERRASEDTDSPARGKHQQRKDSFGFSGSGEDDRAKFALDINKVGSGEDPRTTIMIRNIPNKYSQKMLLSAVDENFKGCYDFFYLPIDFKNKCNVGYAFINMTSPDAIIRFYSEFNNKKWERFNSEKVCEIAYARIQGKSNLISHFQNSSLMSEDKKCRPIIFNSQGIEEAFPLSPGHVALNKRRSSLVAATPPTMSPSGSEERAAAVAAEPAAAAASPGTGGGTSTTASVAATDEAQQQQQAKATAPVDDNLVAPPASSNAAAEPESAAPANGSSTVEGPAAV